MANKVVIGSFDGINHREIAVLQTTQANDFVVQGNIFGLANDAPVQGDDGTYRTVVDTRAVIRLDNVSGAYTMGQTVYRLTGGGFASASATGAIPIGSAHRAKGAAAGPLFVQLGPVVTPAP